MKQHRSTPLDDLYPSPPMAESKTTDEFMKKNSSGNDNLKVKCSSINADVIPSLCVNTLKSLVQCNKEIVDSVKTLSISEDQEVPQTIHTSQTEIRDPEEDDQHCLVVEGLCQREGNGAMLMSIKGVDDADVRNVTPDGPSCGSSIEEVKCSVKARYCSAESSMGTVNFSGRSDPSEAFVFRDEKDGDALENVVRPECSMKQGVSPQKEVTNSSDLGLNCNKTNCVSSLGDVGLSDGSAPAPDCLNSSHGNKHRKCGVPTTNMHESSLHGQTKIDNGPGELIDVRVCDICGDVGREALLVLCSNCSDGAEHIYCMRVKMDTVPERDWVCEDCMMMQDSLVRLDTASKLPNSQEAGKGLATMNPSGKKRSSDMEVRSPLKRRILEGNVRPLKLSGSQGIASLTRATSLKIMDKTKESPSQIYSYDDLSAKKVMGKASSPLGHRSPKPFLKNRTLQKNVQPLKSYGSARKTLLTQVSLLKITDKRKVEVWKSPSVEDQSAKKLEKTCLSPSSRLAKPQQHIHGGYEEPGKDELFKCSNSNVGVRRPHEDVKLERNNLRESSGCQMFVMRPKKRLVKSMSFSGVRTGLNTPNSYFPHAPNTKSLNCSDGEKSTEKYGSSENRSPRGLMPVACSGAMRVKSSRTTLTTQANTSRSMLESEISKVPCSSRSNVKGIKDLQENEESNAKALGSPGRQKSANTSDKSSGENMLSSDAQNEIRSSKNANSDANRSFPPKVEVECFSGVGNEFLVKKFPWVDSLPIKLLPLPLASSAITAVPGSECIWRGGFELEHGGKLPKDCSGIQAHLSTCASSNVLELARKFQPKILVKQVARSDVWPNQFERNNPTEKDVAIYFFAEDFESYSSSYKGLLDGMMENDLALEANFDGFQFLILPSSLLPAGSQRWNTLFFLWGVFRVRKIDNYGLQDPSMNALSLNQGIESFDPIALEYSESTKTKDCGGENEVSSKKCFPSRETLLCEPVMIEVADDTTENKCFSDGVPCNDGFQKEDGQINPSGGTLGKTHIFLYDESDKENPVLMSLETSKNGFCYDGNDKLPLASFAWTYDPASKFWPEKRLDVSSWSSISIDSGPSGSSDGGGCAKSDEGQVEQLRDPSNYRALNLDLCLGSGWDPQGQVDLDLVLGLSRANKYEHDHHPKGISYDKGDISLSLSLGMPYSNG